MSAYAAVEKLIALPDTEYVEPNKSIIEMSWNSFYTTHKTNTISFGKKIRESFFATLSPQLIYLAHGSYGSCPRPVLEAQEAWSNCLEGNPVDFYYNDLYRYLVRSIRSVAKFLHAAPKNIVLVKNVEYGISSVLRSLQSRLQEGDILIAFDFTYEGVLNAIKFTCEQKGARFTIIPTKSPISKGSLVRDFEAFLNELAEEDRSRIKLALFEHISSPSGMVLPVKHLIEICRSHNILSLVDGAHAIGQLDLYLEELAPDFYVSNTHKWLCNVRGCAIMYVRPEHQSWIHPLVITWGYNKGFQSEFIWQGTDTYTPLLTLYTALEFYNWVGFRRIQEYTQLLAAEAGRMLSESWKTLLLSSDPDMFANMVSVQIPPKAKSITPNKSQVCEGKSDACGVSNLHDELLSRFHVEVPIFWFRGKQYVRVSVHVYNTLQEIQTLANAVLEIQGYEHVVF